MPHLDITQGRSVPIEYPDDEADNGAHQRTVFSAGDHGNRRSQTVYTCSSVRIHLAKGVGSPGSNEDKRRTIKVQDNSEIHGPKVHKWGRKSAVEGGKMDG